MGGTTSACAENTQALANHLRKMGNYLRVRGEYDCINTSITASWELPPRARRIRGVNPARRIIRGTTSACAENTYVLQKYGAKLVNYLRVRGEYGWHAPG